MKTIRYQLTFLKSLHSFTPQREDIENCFYPVYVVHLQKTTNSDEKNKFQINFCKITVLNPLKP